MNNLTCEYCKFALHYDKNIFICLNANTSENKVSRGDTCNLGIKKQLFPGGENQ